PNATSLVMTPMGPPMVTAVPSVAYRTVAVPNSGLAMLHQRAQADPVDTKPGGYSEFGMCPGVGIVHDAITVITPGTAPTIPPPLGMIALAVDLAVSSDGSQVAIASASGLGPNVATYPLPMPSVQPGEPAPCLLPSGPPVPGQAVAVAYDGQNR